jgi:hydroxyacylglutathione hydrolase
MKFLIPSLLLPILASGKLRRGDLPKSFVETPTNPPPWQIHSYNENTYILRQSGFTDAEKPFLYLMFGEKGAFLLDTGSRYVLNLPHARRSLLQCFVTAFSF